MTDSEYFCQDRSVSVLVYALEVSDPSFPLFPTGSVDWSPEDFLHLVNCCHSWLVHHVTGRSTASSTSHSWDGKKEAVFLSMHFVSTSKAVHEYVQYSASGKRGRKRVIGSLLWSLEREREREKWKSLSQVQFFATPWTVQSMKFFRTECWSG